MVDDMARLSEGSPPDNDDTASPSSPYALSEYSTHLDWPWIFDARRILRARGDHDGRSDLLLYLVVYVHAELRRDPQRQRNGEIHAISGQSASLFLAVHREVYGVSHSHANRSVYLPDGVLQRSALRTFAVDVDRYTEFGEARRL
ncbi:hypothetical protein GOALK_040_00290 [Gordonia alkanivorans NBRC 16433]|uniref:Uncharacterized protein n=1 Tax=Gordonia alkanivorans NBRC 16433 TaxID=1027371 RepID=F9VT37_9ACTN|nr:hypothetical protein GOALK_040_00290 [Gordonia alkanivorans NBRC 16433]